MKVYSMWKNPPELTGQTFTEESLTDELADEPLKRIYERFVLSGQTPHMVNGDLDYNADEETVESAFADTALDDVTQLSRVEQQDILATAERLVEQLRIKSAEPLEETGKTSPVADKSQSEPSTGEKKENA